MGTGLGSPRLVSPLPPAPCPQVFYWSHLSYVSVWVLLLLHAPNFWKWFVVPGGLFVLEKAVGLVVSRAVGLRIVEVNLLPSKVRSPRAFLHSPPFYLSIYFKFRWQTIAKPSAWGVADSQA